MGRRQRGSFDLVDDPDGSLDAAQPGGHLVIAVAWAHRDHVEVRALRERAPSRLGKAQHRDRLIVGEREQ